MVNSIAISHDLLHIIFFFSALATLAVIFILLQNLLTKARVKNRLLSLGKSERCPENNSVQILRKTSIKQKYAVKDWSLKKSGVLCIALGLLCVLFWQILALSIFIGVCFMALGIGLLYSKNLAVKKRRKQLSDQFPEALDLMVRGGRVGVTPEESMRQIMLELPSPLADVFKSISEQLDIGLSFEQVFSDMSQKLGLREFRYLSATLIAQRKTGGRYVDVIENLGLVLRDHQEQGRKTEAITSEARFAAKIISLLVLISCGLMFFINRSQLDFFMYDQTGQQLTIYCALSLGTGFFVMHRLLGRYR